MDAPLVFGHRGAAGLKPENTLASFEEAIRLGCDAVEFDVQRTLDKQFICIHDYTLERTTNGTGFIKDATLEELRSLDAGGGAVIPTLDETIECIKGRSGLVCELKGKKVVEGVVRHIRRHKVLADTIFISFHPQRLMRLQNSFPDARIGVLLWEPNERMVRQAVALKPFSVTMNYRHLSMLYVDIIRDAGCKVGVYTPNDEPELSVVLALGVDMITTDRPDTLLKRLGRDVLQSSE